MYLVVVPRLDSQNSSQSAPLSPDVQDSGERSVSDSCIKLLNWHMFCVAFCAMNRSRSRSGSVNLRDQFQRLQVKHKNSITVICYMSPYYFVTNVNSGLCYVMTRRHPKYKYPYSYNATQSTPLPSSTHGSSHSHPIPSHPIPS
jgi:hypothetical protein